MKGAFGNEGALRFCAPRSLRAWTSGHSGLQPTGWWLETKQPGPCDPGGWRRVPLARRQ